MAKRIFIDPGDFYTKIVAYDYTGGSGKFIGRSFFPSIVFPVQEKKENILYYEHEDQFYKIGYDCTNVTVGMINDRTNKKVSDFTYSDLVGRLILKKAIFDYTDEKDDLEIALVIGSPRKLEIFSRVVEKMMTGNNDRVVVDAFRGYDRRRLTKSARVNIDFKSAGDGIFGLIRKIKEGFTSALVVDIGYNNSSVYVVRANEGVEATRLIDNGAGDYFKSIAKLMESSKRENISFLWMVKQVELGCKEIDSEENGEDFDVTQVLNNVRWDLNKIFYAAVSDIITSYFANTTKGIDMLVVIGGGAALSGELLYHSLVEGGFKFNDCYIEQSTMYPILNDIDQFIDQSEDKTVEKIRKAQ